MESETPAQLPQQPAQLGQPDFIQVLPGQPTTTPQGQPIQGYNVPVGQSVQPEQGTPGQYVPHQQQAGQGGFKISINTEFLKSRPCFIKIAEFVTLLGAWASILKYEDNLPVEDEKANFFKGIMIFSWVIVMLYLIIYTLNVPKMCNYKRPSLFTIASLVVDFILFFLLLACIGNLVPRAVHHGRRIKSLAGFANEMIITFFIALVFGFISCSLFVVDMKLNNKIFQAQRAQELPPAQGPPQRMVWDINQEYVKSPLFNVKLVEMEFLFNAWVCILTYFDLESKTPALGALLYSTADLPNDKFFRGITIFTWVMVIFLAFIFIFSFDKISSRSSPWTLTAFFVHLFLSILLIASCGYLTPLAITFVKGYKRQLNIIPLYVGLSWGYISWTVLIKDLHLLFKLYRQQRMQEFLPHQGGQAVVLQPGVVIMPQNVAQGGRQQVFQPAVHPGQQVVQYPG